MSKQPVGRLDEESDESTIADYLQSNPDFFERHATLLTTLKLPHNRGSSAISLVERQVAALRDKNEKLEARLRELIEVARSNDVLAAKIHRLACRLVRAQSASRFGGKSFDLDYDLRVGETVVAEAKSVLVAYDYGKGEAVELPNDWREKLAA